MAGGLNSTDKNNLIITMVFITMVALALVFFNLSRTLPMLYMFVGIELFEILYVLPEICGNYYKLYGMDMGMPKWIPYYNVLAICPTPVAICAVVMFVVVVVLAFIAFGPMFWVTAGSLETFVSIQYRAYGWLVVALIVWSVTVGIGYIRVMSDVDNMKAEFTGGFKSKLEFINDVLVLLPVARCFVLFSLLSKMKALLRSGYEYGKDYTELEFEEEA